MSGELRGLFAVPWERKGVCNGCGWCCEYTSINRHRLDPPPGGFTPTDIRYHLLRGALAVEDEERPGKVSHFHLLTSSFARCSAFDTENRNCSIYDQRPAICRVFPQIPEQIEGTPCSYYFEVTDATGRVFRRGGNGSLYPTPPTFPESGEGVRS